MLEAWLLRVYLHAEGWRKDKFTDVGLKWISSAALEGMIDAYDVWIISGLCQRWHRVNVDLYLEMLQGCGFSGALFE